MARVKGTSSPGNQRPRRPAISPDARMGQLVSLAVDRAEQQLRDGTASSQVITHFLKYATREKELELQILERQSELMAAKTEALQSAKKMDELYEKAIKAMATYSGRGDYDY